MLVSATFFRIEWDGTSLKQTRSTIEVLETCPHLTVLYDGHQYLTVLRLATGSPPYFPELLIHDTTRSAVECTVARSLLALRASPYQVVLPLVAHN